MIILFKEMIVALINTYSFYFSVNSMYNCSEFLLTSWMYMYVYFKPWDWLLLIFFNSWMYLSQLRTGYLHLDWYFMYVYMWFCFTKSYFETEMQCIFNPNTPGGGGGGIMPPNVSCNIFATQQAIDMTFHFIWSGPRF